MCDCVILKDTESDLHCGLACETNSLFTLAWNGYEPVHGIVLKNGSPPFTLATTIGVSITHAAAVSPVDGCCYGYFISA